MTPRPALNVSTMNRAGLRAVLPIGSKPFQTLTITFINLVLNEQIIIDYTIHAVETVEY